MLAKSIKLFGQEIDIDFFFIYRKILPFLQTFGDNEGIRKEV